MYKSLIIITSLLFAPSFAQAKVNTSCPTVYPLSSVLPDSGYIIVGGYTSDTNNEPITFWFNKKTNKYLLIENVYDASGKQIGICQLDSGINLVTGERG